MTSARASIAELLGSGMTLTASEAVAIARAALAFDPARAAGSNAPSGLPLSDTLFVEPDGSIVGLHAAPPTITEVASLLRSLLPLGTPGVPDVSAMIAPRGGTLLPEVERLRPALAARLRDHYREFGYSADS